MQKIYDNLIPFVAPVRRVARLLPKKIAKFYFRALRFVVPDTVSLNVPRNLRERGLGEWCGLREKKKKKETGKKSRYFVRQPEPYLCGELRLHSFARAVNLKCEKPVKRGRLA